MLGRTEHLDGLVLALCLPATALAATPCTRALRHGFAARSFGTRFISLAFECLIGDHWCALTLWRRNAAFPLLDDVRKLVSKQRTTFCGAGVAAARREVDRIALRECLRSHCFGRAVVMDCDTAEIGAKRSAHLVANVRVGTVVDTTTGRVSFLELRSLIS